MKFILRRITVAIFLTFLCLLIGVTTINVANAGWSSQYVISSNEIVGHSSLAVGPDGTVHIAWAEKAGSSYPDIYYKSYVIGTGWSSPFLVSQNCPGWSDYPSLAVGPDGTVHIAWFDTSWDSDTNDDILYRRFEPGVGWTPKENIIPNIWPYVYPYDNRPSLAVGPDGTLHLAWQDYTLGFEDPSNEHDLGIWYMKYESGTGWSPKELVSTESTKDDSLGPSLGVGSDGTVHIAWEDWTNYDSAGSDHDIFYKRYVPGSGWTMTEVVSTDSTDYSGRPSLGVGSDGTVHIAWEDRTNYDSAGSDIDIFYKRYVPGSGWTMTEVVSTVSTERVTQPSLGVGSDGTVHIAWADKTNWDESGADYDILYKRLEPSSGWTVTDVVSTESTDDSFYPSLDTGPDGSVHVAWNDDTDISGSDKSVLYKKFEREPPVADAGGPYAGYEGSVITFDASSSHDPDGSVATYEWDLDGDGNYDDGTGVTATHTWLDDYSGIVGVKVTDNDGLTSTDTTSITIYNVAPNVNAGSNQVAGEGDQKSFSGSYTDPGVYDSHTILWDFGDGTTTTGTLTPTHVYGDNGDFDVTLTITDDDGGVGKSSLIVTVNNLAPAITPFGPITVDEGTERTFAAESIDPGSDDLEFKWEFESGTTIKNMHYNDGMGADPLPSPGGTYPFTVTDSVSFVFGDNGFYTIILTVTDDDGGSTVYSTTVTVNNVAPTLVNGNILMTPPNPNNPEFILPAVDSLIFSAEANDLGSDDLTFSWDWDDGTEATTIYYNDGVGPDPYPSPGPTYPFSATDVMSKIFSDPGTFTVTLTVEDDDGGVTIVTYEIKVLTANEANQALNNFIQGLDDSYFKDDALKRKNAFNNMFSAIEDMLNDGEYNGAICDLISNIRQKADGFVDGRANNDWIIDQAAQIEVCWKVDYLISYLSTLFPP